MVPNHCSKMLIIMIVSVSLCLYLILYLSQTKEHLHLTQSTPNNHDKAKAKPPKSQKEKAVLFYTTWFGQTKWPTNGLNQDTNMFEDTETGKPCEYTCRLTYNKDEFNTCDALIFHSRDLPGDLDTLSRRRINYRQRWIYNTHENPYLAGREGKTMKGIFNWTMTVRRSSDVYYPYFQYRALTPEEVSKVDASTNHAKGKTNLIAWSVSNCKSNSYREDIGQNLLKFLPIVINGKCMPNYPKRKNAASCGVYGSSNCTKLYRSTKFYLSFENGLCPGYVTEKYYSTPINHGMVPIVFGPQEYYKGVAIPESYINLFDFPSIEALANYLKYLDRNDTAYNEYFKWKTKYKIIPRNVLCKFCEMLHDATLPPKTYSDLDAFYGKGICDKDRVKKYLLLDKNAPQK